MRIVYLTDMYEPEINGVSTSITNFTQILAENGHKILIIAPTYKNRKERVRHENITVKRFPAFSFSSNRNTRIAYPALMGIVKELRDFEPDIVHIQTPISMGLTGLIASKILKVPTIQTYHGHIPHLMVYLKPTKLFGMNIVKDQIVSMKVFRKIIESDVFNDSDILPINRLRKAKVLNNIKNILGKIKSSKKESYTDKLVWDFTRFLYAKSPVCITPSKSLVNVLEKHKIDTKIVEVSNGIDYDSVPKKTSYKLKYKIIHTGRLGLDGKNVEVIIQAFALAKKDEPRLTLDIYGDGPAAKSLKNLAIKLNVLESVNFKGFLSHDKLLSAYRESDFFVTASTMETQGLVLLEAVTSGLPVIGVDALAVPDLVHNNVNGYLVKPFDPKEMAKAMLRMTKSAEQNEKFGKNSLEIAKYHDLDRCVEKLEKIYEEVIMNSHSLVVSGSK